MSTIRSVQSLPISQSLLDKLESHGFRYVSDLKDVKPFDLVSELGVSPSIAMSILETAKQSLLSTTSTSAENIVVDDFASKPVINSVKITAKDLLTKYTTKNRPIITFCKSLDAILGGGVQIGQITEFCGVPGIGKTQLAIQLALNAQIAEVFGGNAGEAVYIDTEGSFMPERAAEMATELSSHLRKIAKISESRKIENFASQKVAAESLTMERFVNHCNRVGLLMYFLSYGIQVSGGNQCLPLSRSDRTSCHDKPPLRVLEVEASGADRYHRQHRFPFPARRGRRGCPRAGPGQHGTDLAPTGLRL